MKELSAFTIASLAAKRPEKQILGFF